MEERGRPSNAKIRKAMRRMYSCMKYGYLGADGRVRISTCVLDKAWEEKYEKSGERMDHQTD